MAPTMSAYASDLAAMILEKAMPDNLLGGIWHCERGVSSLCTILIEQVSRVRQRSMSNRRLCSADEVSCVRFRCIADKIYSL
jgi:hypothetical protein